MTAYAWFIMGQSFVTTALVFGVWFSYAVFFVAMLEEFDWGRGEAAMAFSVGSVVQAASSPLVGMLTDRWGPRVVVVGGLAAMALGLAACSLVQSLWHLIALFGVIVGFGVGLAGQVSHAALLSRWFVRRRGTIIGFAFAGMGLGIKVMGPLSQALMSRFGWRYAFVALGGITALYALSVLLTLRNQPADIGQQPYGADKPDHRREAGPPQEASWTVRQALRTPHFWALGLAQVLIPLGIFPVSVHQVAYLTDLGFSRVLAAGVLGYMGVMSSCGRMLFGLLSDRLGRFGGVTMSVVLSQLGILALLMVDDASVVWPLYFYAICFGLGYGARGPIISAIAADRFPGRSFATIFGFISIGHGLGGALGPWYGGAMYDHLGSYDLAFALSIVSLCGVIGCFWVATRRGRRGIGSTVFEYGPRDRHTR